MHNLKEAARNYAALRDRIQAEFELDDDDQALADTLEGESNLPELCAAAIRMAHERKAHAEAIADLIGKYKARKERLELSVDRLRASVADAMMEAGLKKLVLPEGTLSVRMGNPRTIIRAEDLPDAYKMPRLEMIPNKEKIQAALADGLPVPGVEKTIGAPILTVRGA